MRKMLKLMRVVGLMLLMLGLQSESAHANFSEQIIALNQDAIRLYQQGKYSQAQAKAQQALMMAEKSLGPDHRDIGTYLNNLAAMYKSTGAYDKALPLLRRSLMITEKTLGPEHAETGNRLNNLASLYQTIGAYDKALPLYLRALAIQEKAVGLEHFDTGTYLSNLATLYRTMGLYKKALPLYQQALAIYEKNLGLEHPNYALTLNNLAGLYKTMGAYDKALPLYQSALTIGEKVFGSKHPSIGTYLNNLAELYSAMGEYRKAAPAYQRALAIAEDALGPEHPDIGTHLNNLAMLYQTMGAYEKALPLHQRALTNSEKALGPEHPETASRLNNLAEFYSEMGAYDKAFPLYQRALVITEKALGPEHPITGTPLKNLADLYRTMGEYDKALPIYQRALAISEKKLGPKHPETGARQHDLANLYNNIGAYDKALPLYQRSLAISEKTLGPEHPETGASLNNLAGLYHAMNANEKALPLLQRALAIAEKALGAEHPDTGSRQNNLAELYRTMGAYDKALPLYQSAVAISEKTLGKNHPTTGIYLNNMALFNEARGKYDDALPLMQRALAISEKAFGPDHFSTEICLHNLALVYKSMGTHEKALPLLMRSFSIAISRSVADPELLANIAESLCIANQTKNRTEAIFYCKLAVNTRQSQRIATKNLPGDLRQSFAKNTENSYLLLNHLLNQANRTTEAAQVIRAMKEAEFSEFVSGRAITKSQINLVPTEANLNNLLRESAAKLQPLLAKQEALRKAKSDQAELDKLEQPITVAKKHLYETFEQIPIRLKSSDEEVKAQFKIDNNIFVKHLANLNAATPDEKNAIIVIAASNERTQISTFYEREPLQLDLPIAKARLSQLVTAMQAGIVAKADTWRAPARELHALLIAPVEAQLIAKKFTPQNISFVISGEKLDIPPLAALLDTNGQFLASKYRLSLYNPRTGSAALQDWKKNWDITAFGSTKGEPSEKLLALPQVEKELAKIVRSEKTPKGALPGEKYLDQQFTRKAWGQSIANNANSTKRRVLHVATHFQIGINQHQSKLLMGDGQFYSAEEIAAEPGLPLSAIDLVTLSACNTVQRKVGKGSTFEGLGALFQYKGANAVLGTLWAVTDVSTAELMQKFYTNRGEQRKMSKAQALQEAQIEMLTSKNWQHPYYWAGFVLMGNWL